MELYKALCEISGEGNVLKDEPMKMHTTFRIGGPADYFIQPSKIEEIRRIVAGSALPHIILWETGVICL